MAEWLRRGALGLCVLGTVMGLNSCGGDDDATPSPTAVQAGTKGSADPKSAIGKKINDTEVPEATANGRRLGAADAKVVIEAYEDFGCPHCLDFTANIEPSILKEYVTTGKVAFEYRYFPLRQLTAGAAIAAECAAAQGKFWPYHRALFIAQAEANEKVGPAVTESFSLDGLHGIAAIVGLDPAKFEECIDSDEALTAVQTDLKKANELGLPGTPSFVINGAVVSGPGDYAGWKKLLDGLLK